MAEVMRSALGNEIFHAQPLSYIILAIWALLGFFGAIRFLERAWPLLPHVGTHLTPAMGES